MEPSSACRALESGHRLEIQSGPTPVLLWSVLHKDVGFVSSICMYRKCAVYLETLTAYYVLGVLGITEQKTEELIAIRSRFHPHCHIY